MSTSAICWPWWHPNFQSLVGTSLGNTVLKSGCAIAGNGNIPCDPDAMRVVAESSLRTTGALNSLSLETYTLARYMQGEVGNGTIEERVAVGEAARNRAKLERTSILGILLYRQAPGHPNRGYYGPIHGVGTGTSTAPYGRWASTSADPTVLTTLLANLVASGDSDDFSRGADDQDGPEYWAPGKCSSNCKTSAQFAAYVRNLGANGKFWVGPLPGINHWRTFLQTTIKSAVGTPEGEALIQRGIAALTLPITYPEWPANLPVCGRPLGWGVILAGIFGTIGGAWWFTRRAARGIAK